jgi:hypothetical protein
MTLTKEIEKNTLNSRTLKKLENFKDFDSAPGKMNVYYMGFRVKT